jgi:hypothetical protein
MGFTLAKGDSRVHRRLSYGVRIGEDGSGLRGGRKDITTDTTTDVEGV